MVEMGLEELKSRKPGIRVQNGVVLALLGPKWRRFGAPETF